MDVADGTDWLRGSAPPSGETPTRQLRPVGPGTKHPGAALVRPGTDLNVLGLPLAQLASPIQVQPPVV